MTTRLNRNIAWMLVSRLGTHAFAICFNVALARSLGAAAFGEYASLAALLFVANAFTTFGTDMLLIREIAVSGLSSRLRAALMLQLALSGALITLVWVFGSVLPGLSPEAVLALRLYSLALIPLAFFTVFTTALRGSQHMDAYMLLNLALAAGQLAVLFLPRPDLVSISLVLLGVQIGGALLAGTMCSVTIPRFWPRWWLSASSLRSLLGDAAPMAVLSVLLILYQRLIVLMLLVLASPASAGLYAAASRMIEPLKMLQAAAFTALYPVMAQEAVMPRRAQEHPSQAYLRLLLVGACLAALLLFILAPALVTSLYGAAYAGASATVRILAWALVPFTANTYLTLRLLASGREPSAGRVLATALFGEILLGVRLIPAAGPEGAAWAVLGAEGLQSLLLLVAMRSRLWLQGRVRELPQSS